MAKLLAIVKPQLILWARKSAGLDAQHAARKIGVPREVLNSWEHGSAAPTVTQLKNAARAYGRPLAVFYLDEPPVDFQPMKTFRRLPGQRSEAAAELVREMRHALARREVALEMAELLRERVVPFRVSASRKDGALAFAQRLRRLLGVTAKSQEEWGDAHEALRTWKVAVERLGVLVFQTNVPLEEMRGAASPASEYPVILLNTRDTPQARTFSLAHELAHLVVDEGGVCSLEDDDDLEVFCNAVAGELLVPADALRQQVAPGERDDWTEGEVRDLARRFWVSTEVVARRLVTTGRATQAYYARRRAWFLKIGVPRIVRRSGPVPVFRKVVARAGVPYLRLVIGAYKSDRITASELTDHIGAKLKHLSSIEAAIATGVDTSREG